MLKEISEKNKRIANDLVISLENLKNLLNSGKSGSDNAMDSRNVTAVRQTISEINLVLEESVAIRIGQDQLNNSTVQVLLIANMVDRTLDYYALAFGIKNNDYVAGDHANSTLSHDSHSKSLTANPLNTDNNKTIDHLSIVNISDYQSSRAFATGSFQLFKQIKNKSQANKTDIIKLENAFIDFKNAIDNKNSYDKVTEIAHGRIHPDLQAAYNLQLVPEFPFALVIIITAFAILSLINKTKKFRTYLLF